MKLTSKYALLGSDFCTPSRLQPLDSTYLIHVNQSLVSTLDIQPSDIDVLCNPTDDIDTFACAYSGHQFGQWAGQLGDGRALLLGQIKPDHTQQNTKIEQSPELQLKGSGTTPYSRFADGRAVLRSSIREYLASEALTNLGIPSTRALALMGSHSVIQREQKEPAALLLRSADTFIRFGTFEHFFYQGQHENLLKLSNFVIDNYYPQCRDTQTTNETLATDFTYLLDGVHTPYRSIALLLKQCIQRTALLIAKWQVLGFCHGVMNTDNMSIIGDTIDYGPYGFIETYQPQWICNHSDYHGRYAYHNQPSIGLWNCNALAHCFSNWLPTELLSSILKDYELTYWSHYYQLMAKKLGLTQHSMINSSRAEGSTLLSPYGVEVKNILSLFLQQLEDHQLDYSQGFRMLSHLFEKPENITDMGISSQWINKYTALINVDGKKTVVEQKIWQKHLLNTNPKFILRNSIIKKVTSSTTAGNFELLEQLFHILKNPFAEHPQWHHWSSPSTPEEQADIPSCSS